MKVRLFTVCYQQCVYVSIHAPMKVRRGSSIFQWAVKCFNSRTHEGATPTDKVNALSYKVSIHAPVKVRQDSAITRADWLCFNSRTREGATPEHFFILGIMGFNSRTREGATQIHKHGYLHLPVSIHAPVKVRHFCQSSRIFLHSFNSRTREGATCHVWD